jgi:hypothetical protein
MFGCLARNEAHLYLTSHRRAIKQPDFIKPATSGIPLIPSFHPGFKLHTLRNISLKSKVPEIAAFLRRHV